MADHPMPLFDEVKGDPDMPPNTRRYRVRALDDATLTFDARIGHDGSLIVTFRDMAKATIFFDKPITVVVRGQ